MSMDTDKCWHASCEVNGKPNPACRCDCHNAASRPMVSFTKTEARAISVLLSSYVSGYHYRSQSPAFLATLKRIRGKVDAFVGGAK